MVAEIGGLAPVFHPEQLPGSESFQNGSKCASDGIGPLGMDPVARTRDCADPALSPDSV